MKIAVFAAAALLAGCATAVPVNGPNGRPALSVHCGINATRCYEKAGQMCPAGYTFLDQANGSVIVATGRGLAGGSHHDMLIECK